jgi:exopolysaccharide biosynthesis polyprenyl glycosylphosphotransferase
MIGKRKELWIGFLFLADLVALTVSWLLAYWLRFHLPVIPVTKGIPPFTDYAVFLFGVYITWWPVFHYTRLDETSLASAGHVNFFRIVKAIFLHLLLFTAVAYFFREYKYSRVVLFYFAFINLVFLNIDRWIIRRIVRSKGRYASEPLLIVGAGTLGRQTAEHFKSHPELSLRVAGFLAEKEHERDVGDIGDIPVLGGVKDLGEIIRSSHIKHVVFALPMDQYALLNELVGQIREELVDIHIIPDFLRFYILNGSIEDLEGIPVINVSSSPLYGWGRIGKRIMDVLISCLMLFLLSPLLLLLAFLVRISSRGPVFYRQERMGFDGKRFTILKFRSMVVDAEEETGAIWAKENDPRTTRIGTFMRSWNLDELPQFYNVLKGEMSLVGPRPERPVFIEKFKNEIPGYMLRHKVKTGITGWAQVNGLRGRTSLKKRIEYDLYYIENWSLGLDIKILLMTLVKGFKNAY